MKNITKWFTACAVIAFVMVSLTGCHTAEGFGKDMEAAGEGLQHEAKEAR
jgi:predicted small secreted protein